MVCPLSHVDLILFIGYLVTSCGCHVSCVVCRVLCVVFVTDNDCILYKNSVNKCPWYWWHQITVYLTYKQTNRGTQPSARTTLKCVATLFDFKVDWLMERPTDGHMCAPTDQQTDKALIETRLRTTKKKNRTKSPLESAFEKWEFVILGHFST